MNLVHGRELAIPRSVGSSARLRFPPMWNHIDELSVELPLGPRRGKRRWQGHARRTAAEGPINDWRPCLQGSQSPLETRDPRDEKPGAQQTAQADRPDAEHVSSTHFMPLEGLRCSTQRWLTVTSRGQSRFMALDCTKTALITGTALGTSTRKCGRLLVRSTASEPRLVLLPVSTANGGHLFGGRAARSGHLFRILSFIEHVAEICPRELTQSCQIPVASLEHGKLHTRVARWRAVARIRIEQGERLCGRSLLREEVVEHRDDQLSGGLGGHHSSFDGPLRTHARASMPEGLDRRHDASHGGSGRRSVT